MSLVADVETAASNFWKKIVALWNKVEPALAADEAELLALLKPLFGQLEAAALQDLTVFIRGIVAAAPFTKGVAEWETVILNLAQVAGGSIYGSIKALSSAAFQSLIGLVLAEVQALSAAQAAKQAAPQAAPAE